MQYVDFFALLHIIEVEGSDLHGFKC